MNKFLFLLMVLTPNIMFSQTYKVKVGADLNDMYLLNTSDADSIVSILKPQQFTIKTNNNIDEVLLDRNFHGWLYHKMFYITLEDAENNKLTVRVTGGEVIKYISRTNKNGQKQPMLLNQNIKLGSPQLSTIINVLKTNIKNFHTLRKIEGERVYVWPQKLNEINIDPIKLSEEDTDKFIDIYNQAWFVGAVFHTGNGDWYSSPEKKPPPPVVPYMVYHKSGGMLFESSIYGNKFPEFSDSQINEMKQLLDKALNRL